METNKPPITIGVDFVSKDLDVSNSDGLINNTMTLSNSNGILLFNVNITETKNDVNDTCTDNENDCELTYKYQGNEIKNGDNINITSGDTELQAIVSCDQLACPQQIESQIVLNSITS